MSMKPPFRSRGLILLVVLGMLAMFSLLSITYVVFASHARSTSVQMARREYRGTPTPRLVDEAMRQLLRGTNDSTSSILGHSILEDLYGSTAPISLTVRSVSLLPNGSTQPLSPASAFHSQRPMILGTRVVSGIVQRGRFLRIPLQLAAPQLRPIFAGSTTVHWLDTGTNGLPAANDIFTGRIVTFREGPLLNQSFRIVRYIGAVPLPQTQTSDELERFAQQYSIIIDLTEADATKFATYPDTYPNTTLTVEDWINRFPAGMNALQSGVFLSHAVVNANLLGGGHTLLMNDAALDGHGAGMQNTGIPQPHVFPAAVLANRTPPPTELASMSVQLQPRFGSLLSPSMPTILGNADESYDAADYNDFWLALRASGAATPDAIIPSFHRAALVNYIANWKDPATYTAAEFVWTLERIVRAVGRPLSINVTRIGPPAAPGDPVSYVVNPNFTGSNSGDYVSATGSQRIPQLVLDLNNNWTTNWPGAAGTGPKDQYLSWLRWLTAGPWDVDNDGDGLNDSVWVDLNLPLMTSPEGKLLRMMAAYYVEDLDGKLDLNAVGNLTQPNNAASAYFYTGVTSDKYAVGANVNLPQGLGHGSGDASLRHLFASDVAYQNFMQARYDSNIAGDLFPGTTGDDIISQLSLREKRASFVHGQLPALPVDIRGRIALGLDRLGNPLLLNSDAMFDQTTNDPYEARWRRGGYQDSPFDLSEWERMLRFNDVDRTNLPRRLANLLPPAALHSVTPKSAHLRVPLIGSRTITPTDSVASFYELVNVVRARKNLGNPPLLPLSFAQFAELFPIEFHRTERFNLNRALGNGFDDDNDGQIDEPEELATFTPSGAPAPMQLSITPTGPSSLGSSGVPEDSLLGQAKFEPFNPLPTESNYVAANNPGAIFRGVESRQLFARHLYCLAQLLIPSDYKFPNLPPGYTPNAKERARLLAQWAVNVVDFRDADAAMTRFAYDEAPLAEKTQTIQPQQYYAWEPDDGVVWGMEQPELLLTESFALHDLRVKEDTSMPGQINQHRIPQGSLFLELYCPRTTTVGSDSTVAGVPSSLYGNNGGTTGVELGKLTPVNIGGVAYPQYPVWRIYVGESRRPVAGNTEPQPRLRPSEGYLDPSNRHRYTYQFPSDPMDGVSPWSASNTTTPTQAGFVYDHSSTKVMREPDQDKARIIVFANGFTPTDQNTPNVRTPARDRVFVNQSGNLMLSGGQYLVVGPRQTTFFGSRKQSAAPPLHKPNTHRVELTTNWSNIFKYNPNTGVFQNAVAQRPTMANCVTMIAAAAAPSSWGASNLPPPAVNRLIGINVSEPLPATSGYYQMPTARLNGATGAPNSDPDIPTGAPGFINLPPDAYNDFSTNPSPPSKPPFDDMSANTPLENWAAGLAGATLAQGTQEDWCTAFLQRLADPEKPYHAAFNPYITIDWIPIDLTVFNGEDDPPSGQNSTFKFASRQKTGVLLDSTNLTLPGLGIADPKKTFYSYHTQEFLPTTNSTSATDVYFNRQLSVDEVTAVGPPPTYSIDRAAAKADGSNSVCTLGFLNYTVELAGETNNALTVNQVAGFQGAPKNVPASLFWANRQFVNPLELAWVPLSAPGQFMQEFTAGNSTNPYTGPSNGFAHLLNMYSNPTIKNGVADYPASTLLEMVETMSPWSDTDSFIPPDDMFNLAPANAEEFATKEAMVTYRAPFNRVPGMVEPGRVNLNTVSEENVFRGLMWNAIIPTTAAPHTPLALAAARNTGAAGSTPYFTTLITSRRGYNVSPPPSNFIFPIGAPPGDLHSQYPTQFAGVFKSPLEAGMVPLTRSTPNVLDAVSSQNPTHTTLLRGSPTATVPLFAPSNAAVGQPNAFTEFLPTTRLTNLVTQKSNVFAVRITVGFFEYDPVTGVGLEYGSEQGTMRRHRGFFIIDRTIPVGFQVGEDLNTDRTILLRRIIE